MKKFRVITEGETANHYFKIGDIVKLSCAGYLGSIYEKLEDDHGRQLLEDSDVEEIK